MAGDKLYDCAMYCRPRTKQIRRVIFGALTVGMLSRIEAAAGNPKLITLYTFDFSQYRYPRGPLVLDNLGRLYGATMEGGCFDTCLGTVFRLAPNAGGWQHTLLYSFQAYDWRDGALPYDGVIMDSSGSLYGTTARGGSHDYGTVFKLTPPTRGDTEWKETIIHEFGGNDGDSPLGGLVQDDLGNLYGTTRQYHSTNGRFGTVLRLTPPKVGETKWTRATLYRFKGGEGRGCSIICAPPRPIGKIVWYDGGRGTYGHRLRRRLRNCL